VLHGIGKQNRGACPRTVVRVSLDPTALDGGRRMHVILALLLGAVSIASADNSGSPRVPTTEGIVAGSTEDGVNRFLGIPYAKPPIGNLRWQEPSEPAAWSGVRQATSFGSKCLQPSGTDTASSGDIVGSEDCLYLNVWTPADLKPGETLPVFFYIHGGALIVDSADSLLDPANGIRSYDGQSISKNLRAVVVTINYRLGLMGFLGHLALTNPFTGRGSGNYGFLDQIQALKWVRRNIARFGGDPTRVLLFGCSAGGWSEAVLVASPLAKGLFAAANISAGTEVVFPREALEEIGSRLARATGCSSLLPPLELACLRRKSGIELLRALSVSMEVGSGGVAFGPVVDNYVLTAPILDLLRQSDNRGRSIHIGTGLNEYSTIIQRMFPAGISSDEELRKAVRAIFAGGLETEPANQTVDAIVGMYPPSDYPATLFFTSQTNTLISILGDFGYHCSARRMARALSAAPNPATVRRYVHSHVFEGSIWKEFGASHVFEEMMLFGNFPKDPAFGFALTPADVQYGNDVRGYLLRLARTGDPNDTGTRARPNWETYDPARDDYFELGPVQRMKDGFRSAYCDFWDRFSQR
jgi:para-nitrobenzyl esterase